MPKVFKILILVLIIGGLFNFGSFRNLINQGIAEEKKGASVEIAETEEIIEQALMEKISQNPDELQRIIVLFRKKPAGRKAFVESLGGRIVHDYSIIDGMAITLPGKAIGRLKELKNVASIQEDRVVRAFLSESAPLINADDVWDLNYDGSGKTVCIVDTGVDDSHSAINTLVAEKCYCSPIPPGKYKRDPCCPNGAAEDDDAMDDNGHGTHCAGIIASQDPTYQGIAPGASLMAVKVLDSYGFGLESDIISGIQWCSDQGADVISISLGGELFSSYCDGEADAQAVNNAVDAGAVVSVASGNDGSTTQISAPACASKAISVGDVYDAEVGSVDWGNPLLCQDTTTYADKIVCHSNRNGILDLLAPGALIMSTVLNNGFAEYGGTSMAAPHVSGAAALLLQKDQNLSPAQIENILKNTGKPIYDSGSGLTFPRIDAYGAFGAPTEPDLTLSGDDISFSNESPSLGETVVISAAIHNDGADYNEAETPFAQVTAGGLSGYYVDSTQWDAQSFTAVSDGYLAQVSLAAWDVNADVTNPDQFLKVSIQSDDGGKPSGTDISSVESHDFAGFTEWHTFTFSIPPGLTGGIKYWITVRSAAADQNGYAWRFATGNPYLGGGANTDETAGEEVVWGTESSDEDFWFKASLYAHNTAVKFYDGDPDDSGILIGTDYIFPIPASGSNTASAEWAAVFGSHDIYVEADPDNLIAESDETNNKAYKSIFAGEEIISITIENNSFDYGTLPLSSSAVSPAQKSTLDLGKTPVITNTGNISVDLAVKSGDAEGGAFPWSLVAAENIAANEYCHQYSISGGASWSDFPADNDYTETIVSDLSVGAASALDLQILMPTDSTDITEKSITVTILATEYFSP